jgi:glycosyltransferase involved in cell wall biosynthesis
MQRDVMNGIIRTSSTLVVMAQKGRELLRTVYDVPAGKIEIIPHGIPDTVFAEPDAAKAKLGFADKSVILTFGLLSPNKGIEVMIDADDPEEPSGFAVCRAGCDASESDCFNYYHVKGVPLPWSRSARRSPVGQG